MGRCFFDILYQPLILTKTILELVEGKSLCGCKFCGTIQSVPLLDSAEKAELCARAETLRREYRYDKAIALYEELIRLAPTDADLYWALTLCRYGAELSPDGSVSLNRIPVSYTHLTLPTTSRV